MAYVSDSISSLARTARHMAILTGCVGAVGIAITIGGNGSPELVAFGVKMFLVTSVVPAVLLFGLSFPVERGRVWAAPVLVVVCVGQLPGVLFCGGCFAVLPSAYLLARCMVAWSEIMFQIRAARRERAARGRGFEPIAATAGGAMATPTVGAPAAVAGRPASAAMLAPKSLKPGVRRPRVGPADGADTAL